MRRTRVYVDTSVFGGTNDDEFAEATGRFLERLKRGTMLLVVSTEVLRELEFAPKPVQQAFDEIPEDCIETIAIDAETEALAKAYLEAGVLGSSSVADALHVASATLAEVDLIVSWNFRHIVNYSRMRKYNAVNVLSGYRPIEIHSPAEVAYDDET